MTLRPQVFPPAEVAAAGLLEKQNRETQAALNAASFVESIGLIPEMQANISSLGTQRITSGTLQGRVGQYVLFQGSAVVSTPAGAQAVTVNLYLNGNNAPAMRFFWLDKPVTATGNLLTVPVVGLLRLPTKDPAFVIAAAITGTAGLTVILQATPYLRLAKGPT